MLSVGISIESLKSARAQIASELKSWKFPEAEKAQVIDKKQLTEASKAAKDLSKGIVQISEAYAPAGQEEQISLLEQQKEQSEKLAKATAFYKLQNDALGPSIANTKAELNMYLRAQAGAVPLTDQEIAKKNELVTTYKKLDEGTKGLLHGLNIQRLLLWALGWTYVYKAMNMVQALVGEVVTAMVQVNEALNVVRVTNLETAESFDKSYAAIRRTIYDVAKDSLISAKDIASAYKILTFEGAKAATASEALIHVRRLMTITGENERVVAQALIETLGLFGNKIIGATSESEKLARITDLLATLFTKAHVSISDYQLIMAFVGSTAADVVPNLDYLVKLLIVADNEMLQGRRAGMALIQVLTGLADDTKKLQELGIFVKYGEAVDVLKVMQLIQKATAGLNEEAKKDLLSKMFKGPALAFVLKLLQKTDLTLQDINTDLENISKTQEDAMKKSHPLALSIKSVIASIGYGLSETWDALGNIIEKEAEFRRAEEERAMAAGRQAKDAAYILKEQAELNSQAIDYVNILREETKTKEEIVEKTKAEVEANKSLRDRAADIQIIGLKRNELDLLTQATELRKLEAIGAPLALISQEKMNTAITQAVGAIEDETQKTEAINALRSLQGATIEENYKTVLAATNDEKIALEYIKNLEEARSATLIKRYEEIKSLADEIQSSTTDFIKNLMTGTANTKEFLASIVSAYQEAYAEQISKMLASTGIFTGMAAAFLSPTQQAAMTLQNAILEGCRQGALLLQAGVSGVAVPGAPAGGATGAPQSAFGAMLSSVGAFLGISKAAETKPTETEKAQVIATKESTKATSKLSQGLTAAKQIAGVAGGLYAGYQGVTAASKVGGVQGALGGALSGAMAGSMFGPIGTIVGGIAGGLMGAFGGKKEAGPAPQAMTYKIESAIKLSNAHLEAISRSTAALNRGFEKYLSVAQTSAYFAESMGIESRFMRDRMMILS